MTSNAKKKVVIVTGANRGLGYGCATELLKNNYDVIATARDLKKLQDIASKEDWPKDRAHLYELDVGDEASLAKFEKKLATVERIDVLINNAGVYLDPKEESVLGASGEAFMKTLQTNVYGPYRMCQIVLPLMMRQKSGRIVNVSSGMGQLSEMTAGNEAYRISKTALNGLTKSLAEDLRGTGILVNSVCPGWVKTDMGGPNASRSLETGVKSILWAVYLPDGDKTGGFYRDGKSLAW